MEDVRCDSKDYYFIGLGGIGMSALARILLQQGANVKGSDLAASPLLEQLRQEGADVHIGHDEGRIKEGVTVVYSSDIKEKNEELKKAKELSLPLLHRSELLGQLMQGKDPILITGTHGKTTTGALLSWVLLDTGCDPTFALGGILSMLNTNSKVGFGKFFVAEADESDGSFLKTAPWGAIVTNLNHDHMDYWKNKQNLEEAFLQFFHAVQSTEHLFWCKDDATLHSLSPSGYSYGFSPEADLIIHSFRQESQGICFDIEFQGRSYPRVEVPLFGMHNALNAAAVFGLSLQLQVPEESIRRAVLKFAGTKRRLELKGEVHKLTMYDDYGHHPCEIAATLKALRQIAKERRVCVLFQPHRFSRVKDLFEEFLTCFSDADLVVLTDIFSAGEHPNAGVTTAALYTRMKEVLGSKLYFFPRQHLEAGVVEILKPLDIVLTLGAGDITRAGTPIFQLWAEKAPKIRVALLCGGTSAEHDVSLHSAAHVLKGLDPHVYDVTLLKITKEGNWRTAKGEGVGESILNPQILEALCLSDVCIPVFHGPQGEDGMIQGFLDTLQIPYVGCDYRSSVVCMNKKWTKQMAIMEGIPTADFFSMDRDEYRENPECLMEKIQERLSFPVWIKPMHLGSSIGVQFVSNEKEVHACATHAFSYDHQILIEKHIEGRQIEFGVIGNQWMQVGPPCEILNEGAFVDYKGKYGSGAMPYEIPAGLSEIERELGIDLAKKIYKAIGCSGLARVDFFIDHTGHFWLNEINTFPGFTDTSAFPKIWAAANWDIGAVCDALIASAFQRTRRLEEIRGR